MKALPPDLGILYRQKVKEASSAAASYETATSSERAKKVSDILDFLRIQVEVREEHHVRPSECSAAAPVRKARAPNRTKPSIGCRFASRCFAASDEGGITVTALAAVSSLCSRPPYNRVHGTDVTPGKAPQIASRGTMLPLWHEKSFFPCLQGVKVIGLHSIFPGTSHSSLRRSTSAGGICEQRKDLNSRSGSSLRAEQRPGNSYYHARTDWGLRTGTSLPANWGRAWAIGASHKLLVRILLDSSSQRTFIRRDLSRTLRCAVRGVEDLSLGDPHPKSSVRCNRVSITLNSQHDGRRITVEALEVPEICAVTCPLVNGDVVSEMAKRNLTPADVQHANTRMEDRSSQRPHWFRLILEGVIGKNITPYPTSHGCRNNLRLDCPGCSPRHSARHDL